MRHYWRNSKRNLAIAWAKSADYLAYMDGPTVATSNSPCRSCHSVARRIVFAAIISVVLLAVSLSEAQAAPDFTLAVTPASIRIARNGKASAIITTAILHSLRSELALTATEAPAGTTLTFSKSSIPSPGAGSSALTFSVSKMTPLGVYPITITATTGGAKHTATVTLTIAESLSLPTGFGWHQLANTIMALVCLGN